MLRAKCSTHRGCLKLSEGRVVQRGWSKKGRLHEDWTEGLVEVEENTIFPNRRGEVGGREG